MIEFINGESLTLDYAIQMLQDEKKLGFGLYYKDGFRDIVGVLEGWYVDAETGNLKRYRGIKDGDFRFSLSAVNSKLENLTPEARCEHMVQYLKDSLRINKV